MMQFIFLSTTQHDMTGHKVIARFGLMHMVATNLCEWLHVLVEETKHEIFHFANPTTKNTDPDTLLINKTDDLVKHAECQRTNIMGRLVQNASPFLFPCTIEYSLICAVILYEMWKKLQLGKKIPKERKSSSGQDHLIRQFSIDCSRYPLFYRWTYSLN